MAFGTKSRGYVDEGMHRSIFSLSRIYGSIIDDRKKNYFFYSPIRPAEQPVNGRGTVSFESGFGISSQGVSPRIIPSATYSLGKFTAGLRFTMVGTPAEFSPGFTSPDGLLDKIQHISFGTPEDFWSVYAGELKEITLGKGLVVNKLSSSSFNNGFHPLGFIGHVRILEDLTVNVFSPSLSSPWFWGMYTRYTPGNYNIGLGYIADFNQYASLIPENDMRYVTPPKSDSYFPDITRRSSPVHCVTFDLFFDLISRYDFNMQMGIEMAQKLFGGNDGFVARMPSFTIDINKTSFGVGMVAETGRLLSDQFNSRYFDTRMLVKSDFIDTVFTPNNMLSKERQAFGVRFFYKMNPIRGLDIDASWKQDILSRNTVVVPAFDTTRTRPINGDFTFELRAAIDQSLFKYFQYAEILLQQSHGRLMPQDGMPFLSWTFNGGYRILSIPLFFNIAFETKGNFFYFDTGKQRNNKVDSNDMFFELCFGVHWGF